MHKTPSPYLNILHECNINWAPYSEQSLKEASMQKRMIFIHIGSINNIDEREKVLKLFSNKGVSALLNRYFVPIAIDIEDFPEIGQIGFDLLSITEHFITLPVNIFMLPDTVPVACFPNTTAKNFIELAHNAVEAYMKKKNTLERAGAHLKRLLEKTGRIPEKMPPFKIRDKLLHAYVRNWIKRAEEIEKGIGEAVRSIHPRYYIFLLKYAYTYDKTDILEQIRERLDRLYYSAMFDTVEGGFFTQYSENDYNKPLFEKQFSENIQAAILYSMAYKCYGNKHYKEAADRTIEHIENRYASAGGGYQASVSLNVSPEKSTYYKVSVADLKKKFAKGYCKVAGILGLDTAVPEECLQIVKNSAAAAGMTPQTREKLLEIRKEREAELLVDERVMVVGNALYACILPIFAKSCGHKMAGYVKKAEDIVEYITTQLIDKDHKLHRYLYSSYGYGDSTLLDYALILTASILLYTVTGKEKYNTLATGYTSYILQNYLCHENGMFLKHNKNEKQLIPCSREPIIDYIKYSANSIMAGNLLLLYKIKGNEYYLKLFMQQIYNVSPQLTGAGPYLAGWALQILNYLVYENGKQKS